MCVPRRRAQLGVAEQDLNDPNIGVRLQQVRRKTVTQSVQRGRSGNAHKMFGRVERPPQLARRDRIDFGFTPFLSM